MFALSLPWLLYFDPAARRGDPARAAAFPREEDERRLVCAHCDAVITSATQRIAVAGAHEHTCTNPHGHVFRIGCYAAAPGCTSVGIPTREHTWFPGYRWTLALCGQCRAHLGWEFTGSSAGFYALISGQLRERRAARG